MRRWIAPILVIVAVLAVFWPAASFEFVGWDDVDNVAANRDLNPVTPASVVRYWAGPYRNMYIPATYSAWAGIATIARARDASGEWTLNPWVFHAANLLLHIACCLLVLAIVRRLLDAAKLGDERSREWAALAGALLFAVHPLQVEPVAWVTGLRDLLSTAFALAAVACYLRFACESDAPGRRWGFYCAGLVAFALSLLAKPATLTLPLALAAIDVLILRRPWRRTAAAAGGWLILSIAAAVVTKLAQPAAAVAGVKAWARPLVAADALTFYAGKLLFPVHLAIDYGRSPQWLLSHSAVFWTWVPVLVLAVLLIAFGRRFPWLLCVALIFVFVLLPVLGLSKFDFQRHSTVADRYLYLAMLAPSMLAAWLVARWRNPGVLAAAALVLAAYAARAHAQVWTWQDSQALFTHAVEVNPASLAGNDGLGQMAMRSGNLRLALAHFEAAVAAHPGDAIANYNLANALLVSRHPAAAAEHYRRAMQSLHDPFLYTNLATALAETGDVSAAADACREGLGRWPGNAQLHFTLGQLLAAGGDWPAAAAQYAEALRLDPSLSPARAALDEAGRRASTLPSIGPASRP